VGMVFDDVGPGSAQSWNEATPTLAFATIPAHIYGDAPFSVSATSASSGAVIRSDQIPTE